MKLVLTMLVALAVAGAAAAAPNNATLTIKHQTHGCHSWSFDGKSWHATQTITLVRGGVLTVVDNDVMPHKLIQVSGPKATVARTAMKHMGASAYVGFPAKGTYVFKTRAGDDYMKGIKTIGEDNVLKLVVKVT
jgi:major membrane immunogen (membrane-anchored lipoprotein)